MLGFKTFIVESTKKIVAGIQHSEHPADLSFDGKDKAEEALKTLKGVTAGTKPVTRKIDDRTSFHAIRTPEGKVGVKYKGPGATYNFSEKDIEKQHGEKPYMVGVMKPLLKHLGKVLPQKAGEYQGGFMSTPESRKEDGKVSHTPNTVTYSLPKDSEEGKKLAKSKLSVTVHTELTGKDKQPKSILDQSHFGSHPDVHLVNHVVSKEEQKLAPADKKKVMGHLSAAQDLMKDHSYEHLSQHNHSGMLRRYINSTVDTGEKPSVSGYKAKLADIHNKEIDKVKTEKSKAAKTATRDAALAHVDANKKAFQKTLDIHQHLQAATNQLANSLHKTAHGGVETSINGKESGGEGFMSGNGLKIVDRTEFSKANRERGAVLKAKAKEV